jgi:hypothetical protein
MKTEMDAMGWDGLYLQYKMCLIFIVRFSNLFQPDEQNVGQDGAKTKFYVSDNQYFVVALHSH